ncbi:hypothetical protein [Catenulispora subtropica]|uniref:Uncharacterized protein n=1 Tax=Catenulispora subtropica TaxID=450798 RepID=A0ABP5CIJ4_9ACTN
MALHHRMKRAAVTLAIAGAGATMVATAPSVSAAPPGDCHLYATLTYGQATCFAANSYQAYDVCVHAGTTYTVYGPWTSTGGTSRASCNNGDLLERPYIVYVDTDGL